MTEYSHAEVNKMAGKLERFENKEAREKSQAREYTEKAIVGLSAFGVGFGLGVLNAMNGGTAEAPMQIAGTVALDAAAAGVGAIAILATPTRGASSSLLPVALGGGAAALGIFGHRTGLQWQQARSGAAPAAPTTQGYLGAGSMSSRFAAPGPGGYGARGNPYVSANG